MKNKKGLSYKEPEYNWCLLDSQKAAQMLGLKYQTILNWRSKRKNLNYVMIGSKPMYELAEIERYINANRIQIVGV